MARPCLHPDCPNLVDRGYCPEHVEDYRVAVPDRRKVYASRRWRGARRTVLSRDRWCRVPGCTNLATDVDHILPLRDVLKNGGDPYDLANLQGLCAMHHAEKTASEVWHRK